MVILFLLSQSSNQEEMIGTFWSDYPTSQQDGDGDDLPDFELLQRKLCHLTPKHR
jgi:hypothetical protein